MSSSIRSGKLAGLSTFGALRVVALPVLLQQFLQAMVGMVDKMLAGRLPEDQVLAALDAIGIGSFVAGYIYPNAGSEIDKAVEKFEER